MAEPCSYCRTFGEGPHNDGIVCECDKWCGRAKCSHAPGRIAEDAAAHQRWLARLRADAQVRAEAQHPLPWRLGKRGLHVQANEPWDTDWDYRVHIGSCYIPLTSAELAQFHQGLGDILTARWRLVVCGGSTVTENDRQLIWEHLDTLRTNFITIEVVLSPDTPGARIVAEWCTARGVFCGQVATVQLDRGASAALFLPRTSRDDAFAEMGHAHDLGIPVTHIRTLGIWRAGHPDSGP